MIQIIIIQQTSLIKKQFQKGYLIFSNCSQYANQLQYAVVYCGMSHLFLYPLVYDLKPSHHILKNFQRKGFLIDDLRSIHQKQWVGCKMPLQLHWMSKIKYSDKGQPSLLPSRKYQSFTSTFKSNTYYAAILASMQQYAVVCCSMLHFCSRTTTKMLKSLMPTPKLNWKTIGSIGEDFLSMQQK